MNKFKVSFVLPDETRKEYSFELSPVFDNNTVPLAAMGMLYHNGWSVQDCLDWAVFYWFENKWVLLGSQTELINQMK